MASHNFISFKTHFSKESPFFLSTLFQENDWFFGKSLPLIQFHVEHFLSKVLSSQSYSWLRFQRLKLSLRHSYRYELTLLSLLIMCFLLTLLNAFLSLQFSQLKFAHKNQDMERRELLVIFDKGTLQSKLFLIHAFILQRLVFSLAFSLEEIEFAISICLPLCLCV